MFDNIFFRGICTGFSSWLTTIILVTPAWGVVIQGTTPALNFSEGSTNGTPGQSSLLDNFFLVTIGSATPVNFFGELVVPVFVDYSIDLDTGVGEITTRTADESFLMTVTGQPGAFSLLPPDSIGMPGPLPNFLVAATDQNLLSITSLESPIGTPQPSDPLNNFEVQDIGLGFDEDPSSGSFPIPIETGFWGTLENGTRIHESRIIFPPKTPEPTSTLSLLAFGTLGMGSVLKRKLNKQKSTEKETTKVG